MKFVNLLPILLVILCITLVVGCADRPRDQEEIDRDIVDDQQDTYARVHPIPRFDFSIPRKTFIEIYTSLTTEVNATYTVVTSSTGKPIWYGPSIGMPIPVDTQLTNPLKLSHDYYQSSVIEQPEPNGLWSSKNTRGTYVLAVTREGLVAPIYFEPDVTCFPFTVVQKEDGSWVQADGSLPAITIDMDKTKAIMNKMAGERGIELP